MPTAWERHFVRNEFALATVAALALAAWATWFGGAASTQGMLQDNRAALYGAVASIAGALLGFLITTVALLQGMLSDQLRGQLEFVVGQQPAVGLRRSAHRFQDRAR